MATSILLLGPEDVLQPSDWVRPLVASAGTDEVNGFSTYGGSPVNHLKWVRADEILGEDWMGLTLRLIHRAMANIGGFNYEVVRGELPKSHIMDVKAAQRARGLR